MRPAILTFLLSVCLAQLALPQASAAPPNIDGILKEIKSPRWAERSKAFDEATELLAPGRLTPTDHERLQLGLVQLLIAENARNFPPDDEPIRVPNDATAKTESASEYYASLIDVVADMNDLRAIPALAGSPESSATGGLIKYGDKALEPVFEQLKNPNALVRSGALSTIIAFWGGRDALRNRIRESIKAALSDPTAVVRSNAVDEIACLDDRQDFVATLERIAKTDSENYPGRMDDGVDGDRAYPVRYDARRALREIRTSQPCSWRGITIPRGQR